MVWCAALWLIRFQLHLGRQHAAARLAQIFHRRRASPGMRWYAIDSATDGPTSDWLTKVV